MTSLPLQTYWSKASGLDQHAFCVTNGLFFYMPEYPTRLAFPLKVDGTIVTDGWGVQTYPGQKLMLELWDDHADITALSPRSPEQLDRPKPDRRADRRSQQAHQILGRAHLRRRGRPERSRQLETVLVFNSSSSLQSGAAEVLRSFGADKVMMLDGGGSTQLLCKSGWYIRSDRPRAAGAGCHRCAAARHRHPAAIAHTLAGRRRRRLAAAADCRSRTPA